MSPYDAPETDLQEVAQDSIFSRIGFTEMVLTSFRSGVPGSAGRGCGSSKHHPFLTWYHGTREGPWAEQGPRAGQGPWAGQGSWASSVSWLRAAPGKSACSTWLSLALLTCGPRRAWEWGPGSSNQGRKHQARDTCS